MFATFYRRLLVTTGKRKRGTVLIVSRFLLSYLRKFCVKLEISCLFCVRRVK